MKTFVEKVKNLVAMNEVQEATKAAVIDIAKEKGVTSVEKVLETAIINTQNAYDRAFYEKIYKMLGRYVITKRILAKASSN